MINVNKTYLPPQERYLAIVNRAWQKGWITNNGDLVRELEGELRQKLSLEHLLFTGNGTVVLQMALRAVGHAGGEIITTSYSYVATAHAIRWQGFTPVFVDIEPETYCINPLLVEAAITSRTKAILATHVYGMPCQTEALDALSRRFGIPVVYDAAHAFGTTWQGKSLLSYGHISTCSFHATKVFHTVEGGCIVCHNASLFAELEGYRQFGHNGDQHYSIGINGKNSEFHAAMGLAILPDFEQIVATRKQLFEQYKQALAHCKVRLLQPEASPGLQWNYAYFPVLFSSHPTMMAVKTALEAQQIFPRRYFYPALNTLPYYPQQYSCPVAEDAADRVLCLPFYTGLLPAELQQIVETVVPLTQL
ncbi:MAG: DegT/DnrJ/EryC1/StrS family aminotransferase [Bacteroidetes bacterium]|nr:MAG: DegT/DnrJ/EryC1/StrS family aminotransferase [Bacteroidota bacterium]